MTGEETFWEVGGVVRGWPTEELKALLLAIEHGLGERIKPEGRDRSPEEEKVEQWWREGGVLFKDE